MIAYEEQLNRDFDWALREGGLYFQCRSAVHKTLQRLDKILVDIHVDYAVIGTMAMFYHGYRRFMESIDLVVTPSGLSQFLEVAHRVGFTDPVKDRIVRDSENGVKVVFFPSGVGPLIHGLGQLPIPCPNTIKETINGISVASLPALIELYLASGQASHRLGDLGCVQELVKHLKLAHEFAGQLNPSLGEEFRQIWKDAQTAAEDEY
jgi:hypothetical protein